MLRNSRRVNRVQRKPCPKTKTPTDLTRKTPRKIHLLRLTKKLERASMMKVMAFLPMKKKAS